MTIARAGPLPSGTPQYSDVVEIHDSVLHFESPMPTDGVISLLPKLRPKRLSEPCADSGALYCDIIERTGPSKENISARVPMPDAIVKSTL
jgi:hypothetical protein